MKPDRQAGMSLIELMIGIAVFGILLALGVPTFARWTQNSQIRNSAEAIHNGLMLARAEAVRRNTTVRFQARHDDDQRLRTVGHRRQLGGQPGQSGGRLRRDAFRQCRTAHRPGSFRGRRFHATPPSMPAGYR